MKSREVAETVFESHRFVKRLIGAGMEECVGEALAEEHVALLAGNLPTETALAGTEPRMRADLEKRLAELPVETHGRRVPAASAAMR